MHMLYSVVLQMIFPRYWKPWPELYVLKCGKFRSCTQRTQFSYLDGKETKTICRFMTVSNAGPVVVVVVVVVVAAAAAAAATATLV